MKDCVLPQAGAEDRVIRRAQQCDLAAFNALVRAHQDLAYRVASRILGNRESAADATQESFVKAYRKIGQFRGGSFRAWLLHIVTNTCYDTLLIQRRRPNSSSDADDAANEPGIRLHAGGELPEESAIRQGLDGRIQAALIKLPADQRVVLILRDIEGLTYDEIVAITGMQLEIVKSRLCRGRARLRDLLQAKE